MDDTNNDWRCREGGGLDSKKRVMGGGEEMRRGTKQRFNPEKDSPQFNLKGGKGRQARLRVIVLMVTLYLTLPPLTMYTPLVLPHFCTGISSFTPHTHETL